MSDGNWSFIAERLGCFRRHADDSPSSVVEAILHPLLTRLSNTKGAGVKREPLLIIAVLNIFAQTVLVIWTVFYTDWSKHEAAAVSGVIAAGLNLGGAFFARSLITPVCDPHDNDGNPLHAWGTANQRIESPERKHHA